MKDEEDFLEKCGYCHHSLGEWSSVHEKDVHYKKSTCGSCEKETWVKADFMGSGHDEWNKREKPKKPLDDHIKEIETVKVLD